MESAAQILRPCAVVSNCIAIVRLDHFVQCRVACSPDEGHRPLSVIRVDVAVRIGSLSRVDRARDRAHRQIDRNDGIALLELVKMN